MTNEEAIKWLDEHCLGQLGEGGFETKVLATNALNKQKPKKVIFIPKNAMGDYYGTQNYNCPTCGMYVFLSEYCSWCGQHIKWSD